MKHICMEVKTKTQKNGTEIDISHKAELKAEELTFATVNKFNEDITKINRFLKQATKNEAWVELNIVSFDWNTDKREIENYNRWEFEGYAYEYETAEGYYLKPDTRYTPEHHDMVYNYKLSDITA